MDDKKENEILTGIMLGLLVIILALVVFTVDTFGAELETAVEYSEDDIFSLAKLIQAEAGNQPLLGRQYVADVVLNRIDSDEFPDTLHGVMHQKNQFSVMSDGRYSKAVPTEDDILAARLEVENRINHQVLYFTAGDYGKYGEPAFKVQDHYFCR